jgi:hypothetical protein
MIADGKLRAVFVGAAFAGEFAKWIDHPAA